MAGLILMAMADEAIRETLYSRLERAGLLPQLGQQLFPPECWHQSLSDRFFDTPEMLEKLMDVGRSVTAAPFMLSLNRLAGPGGSGDIHWEFRATIGSPGFAALKDSIQSALQARGVQVLHGHAPHVTISYRAPRKLTTVTIQPVHWTIGEFMLVRRCDDPFRYQVLERWPLLGKPGSSAGPQLDLL